MASELRQLPVHLITPEVSIRFWQKVYRFGGDDSCWLWCGHKLPKGAGTFALNREKFYASRISWYIEHGEDPYPEWILHNCPTGDNMACVNPRHLYLGDCRQNSLDQYSKGQRQSMKGCSYPDRRPKERNEEIQTLWATGQYSQAELSRDYKLTQSMISMIINDYHLKRGGVTS